MKHPRKLQWHYPPSYLWGQIGGMSVMGRDIRQLSNQQRWHALLYELASYSGNVLKSYVSWTKIILAVNVYSLMGNCVGKILKPENSFGGGTLWVGVNLWPVCGDTVELVACKPLSWNHTSAPPLIKAPTRLGMHSAYLRQAGWHALWLSSVWSDSLPHLRVLWPPYSANTSVMFDVRWNWQILDLGLGELELAFDRCILNGMYSCLYLYLYPIGGWLRPDAYEMRKCSPCSLLFQMRPDCKGSGQNCMHTNDDRGDRGKYQRQDREICKIELVRATYVWKYAHHYFAAAYAPVAITSSGR